MLLGLAYPCVLFMLVAHGGVRGKASQPLLEAQLQVNVDTLVLNTGRVLHSCFVDFGVIFCF